MPCGCQLALATNILPLCNYSNTAKTLERRSRKGVVEILVCVVVMEEEDKESKRTEHTSLVSAPSIKICNTHSDKPLPKSLCYQYCTY